MLYQHRFEQFVEGKTISGFKWLARWDDGEVVDPDTPQLYELHFTDGSSIEFDGFGEAYFTPAKR